MVFCMQCGSGSYFRAAMTVAIIDIIYTAIILILFVLGTSLMVGFEFTGTNGTGSRNASRVLDELTDDVFGTRDAQYDTRQSKDIAEDMGVFLIIMFLSMVDFIISCIFFDGVKTKNIYKCQAWFNIRLVILVIFDIVVFINVMYGSSWYRCIPDAVLTVYRLAGILIGYAYLQELQGSTQYQCQHCRGSQCIQRESVINLSGRRKEIQKAMQETPVVTVTGPDESITVGSFPSRRSSANSSPRVSITRKSSSGSSGGGSVTLQKQKPTTLSPELVKDKV